MATITPNTVPFTVPVVPPFIDALDLLAAILCISCMAWAYAIAPIRFKSVPLRRMGQSIMQMGHSTPHRQPDDFEDVPRPVVGIGNDYPSSFELAEHSHRRGQFLYAASGVVAVSTPEGAWVAPPERAVWIPAGTPHSVRMVGAVQTRSVLIDHTAGAMLAQTCRVVSVTPLLRQLLVAASQVPAEYDLDGRDGLVMALLVAEIAQAPVIPIVVPFPSHAALAQRCHRFLEKPQAGETIDQWSDALAMNRRRFTRLFRRETGMSFAEWRQQACLSAALPRLAAGDSITAIALDLGYDGPGNFSTMFKRVLGAPPSRYRP